MWICLLDNQTFSLEEKLEKEDLDNSWECLQSYEKQISDIKTSFDCFVYLTLNGWKAVIDIDHVSESNEHDLWFENEK